MSSDSNKASNFFFLSVEQVDEFFKKYDKNGDGVITKDELIGSHLHSAGSSTPTKNQMNKVQKALARDSPKRPASSLRLSREHMKEIFREHDVDGDGFLDFGELTMAFGFLDSIISLYKARNGLTCADADRDGLIGEDELDKLIDYAEKLYGEEE